LPAALTIPDGEQGGPLTGEIAREGTITVGDLDLWTFEANQGDNIELAMERVTGGPSFSQWLQLYGPTGQLLASVTHSSLAQISLSAPDCGIFVAVASSGTHGGAGTYNLIVTELPEQGRLLRFARFEPGHLTITWPSALEGYVLQQSQTVHEEDGWEDVAVSPTDNGLNTRVSVPAQEGTRFFRLRPPE
jgi:hypothetical protein